MIYLVQGVLLVSAIGSYASIIRTQWQFEENEDFFEVSISYFHLNSIHLSSIKIPMYKNLRKESISSQIQLDTFMEMQFMVVSQHQ